MRKTLDINDARGAQGFVWRGKGREKKGSEVTSENVCPPVDFVASRDGSAGGGAHDLPDWKGRTMSGTRGRDASKADSLPRR